MTRIRIYLFFVLAFSFCMSIFSSCNNEPDQDLLYRSNNETQFSSFADSVDYEKKSVPGLYGDSFVYMKYLERAKDNAPMPIYSSEVKMRYKTYILSNWTTKSSTANPFNSNSNKEVLTPMPISKNIIGVAIALQNMREGDHVMVAVPWYLAYGTDKSSGIRPYTSLFFDIKLESIVKK